MDKVLTPKAAIVLILVGGLLISFSGILAIVGIPTGVTFTDGHLMIQPLQGISIYHGIIEVISGIILIVAVLYIKYKDATTAQNWLIIALIFSIFSLIGGGGFFIGFIMAIIGSILGIIYEYLAMGRNVYVKPAKIVDVRSKLVAEARNSAKMLNTLTREEKRLYSIIEEADGAIFQADLVEKSGFSKVKVSRILDKLEGRGMIERKRRGMTNMVVIKREIRQ